MTSHGIVGLLALATLATDGESAACKRAGEEYHAARSVVLSAIETYERCIDASQGRSECADEFADLDLAQAQHERALAEYQKVCR